MRKEAEMRKKSNEKKKDNGSGRFKSRSTAASVAFASPTVATSSFLQ